MPSGVTSGGNTERILLLLCNTWSDLGDGITSTNRSLATHLSSFKGVKVYSTVLCDINDISDQDKEDADKKNVTLIGPHLQNENLQNGNGAMNGSSGSDVYERFNNDPRSLFPNLERQIPFVTHIIGHSPLTAEGAVKLKEDLYTESEVILFYHVIPPKIDWLEGRIDYKPPNDTELVQLAEKANVVYSVTEKLHWYFMAKFRNRATRRVDHRLYIPQCSEQTFMLSRKSFANEKSLKILAFTFSGDSSVWDAIDVAACAVNKVAKVSNPGGTTRPLPSLIIGCKDEADLQKVKDNVTPYLTCPELNVEFHVYKNNSNLLWDLSQCSLCLIPSRSEPLGPIAFTVLSSGIPTLVSEDSAVASLVNRLTSEPDYFLVPVTPSTTAVRQDASVWRDRILSLFQDLDTAHDRAMQLRMAMRRDDVTKETHDNVITYCLGGIKLRHEVCNVSFHIGEDEGKEIAVQRKLNILVCQMMRQCWRVKHHPLTQDDDLYQLLPGVNLPIQDLVKHITNKVEDKDRRIVGFDEESRSFIVYCPTPDALSDLWAMCDVINHRLHALLFKISSSPLLARFELKSAILRTVISGPEFLRYKKVLVRNTRPKTAAF